MIVSANWYHCSAALGIVFKSASLQQQAGNDYRKDFDCSGLPLGEYVLYIHVNDKAFSEKCTSNNEDATSFINNKIRLQSVAQYGLTIFWRELK